MKRRIIYHPQQVRTGCITFLTCFVFYSISYGVSPSDTLRQHIKKKMNLIVDQYYYTNGDSALLLLTSVEQLARKNNLADTYLDVLITKASVAEHHRLIDSLHIFLEKANDVFRNHERELRKSNAYLLLKADLHYMNGMYHFIMGDLSGSLLDFKEIIFSNAKLVIEDSLYTFDALLNIAQLYTSLQDYAQSLAYYNMASHVLPVHHADYKQAVRDHNYQVAFLNIATAKSLFLLQKAEGSSHRYSEIMFRYGQALDKLKGKEGKAEAQNLYLMLYENLSDAYRQREDFDSALYWINKSLKIIEKGDSERRIKTLLTAGKIYRESGLSTQASKRFAQAYTEADKAYRGNHRYKAQVLYEIGLLKSSNQQWAAACLHYQQALQQITTGVVSSDVSAAPSTTITTAPNEFLKIVVAKADALNNWYNSEPHDVRRLYAAVEHYEFAIAYADLMKQTFLQEESQLTFLSSLHDLYEKALACTSEAFAKGKGSEFLDKSFFIMEKSKASALLQSTMRISGNHVNMHASVAKQENFLRGKLYYWQHQLDRATDQNEMQAIRRKIIQTQQVYDRLIQEVKKKYPSYFNLKYNTHVISIRDVQQNLLSENSAMIEYYYGDYDLYVFLVSRRDINLKRIPLHKNFNSQLDVLLDYIKENPVTSDKSDSSGIAAAQHIYHWLIGPVVKHLSMPVTKLLIIPDGRLGYLPFEVLVQDKSQQKKIKNLSELPYLFKDFVIRYEPSATLAFEKRKRDERNAAFSYVGFAPVYNSIPAEDTRIRKADLHGNLPTLHFNKLEVSNASDFFDNEKAFYGNTATETMFKQYASQGNIIHLSMHALLNNQNPLYSELIFTQQQATSPEDDGYLYVYELYNMNLQADLAVLSACETGTGSLASGEGIISMGRAFQYAGCPAVAMSLWSVNDGSTRLLMNFFLKNISIGMEKDEALQQAKIDFLKDPRNKSFIHPHYWSAFILTGSEAPIKIETSYFTEIVAAVAFLLLLMMLIMMSRRGRE